MKRLMFILFVLLLNIECFSQINTYLISDGDFQTKENSVMYYLPRTVLNVDVEVETEYVIPGPFNKYAEKYLSIKDVPTQKIVTSEIGNIEITELIEPDPNLCFVVVDKKHAYNISLNNVGILSGYREFLPESDIEYETSHRNDFQYLKNDVHFTDYSVKRNFKGITDTTYKVIEVDSVFQKIPVYNEVITSKDFEQKAEEAANYIIKIRKRRFKLQSAQFETEYPPYDVGILIKELDDLEQQYLELFIGKKIKINNSFSFLHIPEKKEGKEEVVMFHLSDELGILEEPGIDTEPVKLVIEDIGTTEEIDGFYKRQDIRDKNKGLFYRMPGHANVFVVSDDQVYIRKHMIIPQYGYLNYLPSKMFSNQNLRIIFDEKYGSLKTISNE